MGSLFLLSVGIIFVYGTLWFLVSLVLKRNDIADIAWGLGYILLCSFYFLTQELSVRGMILYCLILLWGARLSLHIYLRNRGKNEDFRYSKWRSEWGRLFYLRSYLQVYLLQGLFLLVIISGVTIVAAQPQSNLGLLDYLGIFVWMIGFYFESVGDYQLTKFIREKTKKGKVLNTGLWKYSRHPNYFGEVTMWWGIYLIVLSSPNGILGVFSPLLITVLILFVSGVPMLEKKYKDNEEYVKYMKKTSKFFPLPPKH